MLSVPDRARHEDSETRSLDASSEEVVVRAPDSALQGAIDVVTLRAFVRAVTSVIHRQKGERDSAFDQALGKTLSVNDAIAKALLAHKIIDEK